MGKEILDRIRNDIKEQADLVINQINLEIAQLHDEQISIFKDSLKKEQDTYLEKELNDLRILSITESSRAKLETKRKLLNLREELVNELFNEVKTKLISFTKTKDYENYLDAKINDLIFDGGYIICNAEDKELIKKLLNNHKVALEIKEGYFEIGGFKYISNLKNVEYDYSIDTNFSEQTEWFMNNSGFTI